jgi:hypothetical protein
MSLRDTEMWHVVLLAMLLPGLYYFIERKMDSFRDGHKTGLQALLISIIPQRIELYRPEPMVYQ